MSPNIEQLNSAPAARHRIAAQLLTFFAAAYLIAWGAWIPLFKNASVPGQVAFVGLFAPTLAALLAAALWGRTGAVRRILQRLAITRFPLLWALFAAFLMPAIYALAILAHRLLGISGVGPLFAGNSKLFLVAGFLWLLFVTSGEEIGWRGYALPLLLERFEHPVLVGLGLGLLWGVWHLPLYMLPGQSAFPLPLFLVFTSLQSVVYTLIFLRTKGSLLPAILLHAGTDIAPRIFQLAHLPSAFWLLVDAMVAAVTIGLCLAMRRQLSTGKAWQAEQR